MKNRMKNSSKKAIRSKNKPFSRADSSSGQNKHGSKQMSEGIKQKGEKRYNRITTALTRVLTKPYIFWTLGIFAFYTTLNIIISQFYVTIRYIPYYLGTINWTELILSFVFSFSIAALIAINSVSAYIKYQERKNLGTADNANATGNVSKACAVTAAGTAGGLATGVCSACLTGLIPLAMSVIGISFSWAALPFKGLEVQAAVVVLLSLNLYFLTK